MVYTVQVHGTSGSTFCDDLVYFAKLNYYTLHCKFVLIGNIYLYLMFIYHGHKRSHNPFFAIMCIYINTYDFCHCKD